MITGGILTALADYAAQWLAMKEDPEKDLDFRRLASLTMWFTIVGTPLLHGWFGFLERIFPGIVALKALKQVAADQVLEKAHEGIAACAVGFLLNFFPFSSIRLNSYFGQCFSMLS
mmetsp:Transcript_13316/g.53138  ORF Transcript_13316/g.53138 Transcript_13316/m.53138 type:complete len:116 (+) Transcript_13316:767-1114(+)